MNRWLLSLAFALAIAILASPVMGPARAQEHPEREFTECTDCPIMVGIPAGKFLMGSPTDEPGRFDVEGPQHAVTIRAFALGKFPVTVAEFLAFLRDSGYQPSPCNRILGLQWRSPGHGLAYPPTDTQAPRWPATCLNWQDAHAYIDWLNSKLAAAGKPARYRLPSEAEWEYAARAGTLTARWWGAEIGSGNANCMGCGSRWDGTEIAPVGQFQPNGFGLYDALGNVWQWVEDCWHDSYAGAPDDGSVWSDPACRKRVMRGGSWSNLPVFVRSATRSRGDPAGADFDYSSYAGFRVAVTLK